MTDKIKRQHVTLRDVAHALGISKSTVSLVINNSELVAKETSELVKNKMNEMGYVYNRGAAGLSRGETQTIGLAVHDISNRYFSRICASIEEVLGKSNRMAFLCNTNDSLSKQTQFIKSLGEYNADGLILCPSVGSTEKDIFPLLSRHTPVVLIARDIETANVDYVGNDDELALRLATEHLIQLGHQRIAMLGGGDRTSVAKNRRLGYVNALNNANITIDDELQIDCLVEYEGSVEAIRKAMMLKYPPTAVVCFNDVIALGALSELYKMGYKPGQDVAIIGCDGIDESARAYARLSTINIQKRKMGETAAEILLHRISNPDLQVQRVILEPRLIVRSSCGANN